MKRWLILFAGMVATAGMSLTIAQDAPKDRYDEKPEPHAFTSPDGVSGVVMPDGRTVLTGEPTPATDSPGCDCAKGRKAKLSAAIEESTFGLSEHINELRARVSKLEDTVALLEKQRLKQQEQAKLTKPPATQVLYGGSRIYRSDDRTPRPSFLFRN